MLWWLTNSFFCDWHWLAIALKTKCKLSSAQPNDTHTHTHTHRCLQTGSILVDDGCRARSWYYECTTSSPLTIMLKQKLGRGPPTHRLFSRSAMPWNSSRSILRAKESELLRFILVVISWHLHLWGAATWRASGADWGKFYACWIELAMPVVWWSESKTAWKFTD